MTNSRDDYETGFHYMKDVLKNQNVVLRNTSALQCLGAFVGYLDDSVIEVYSLAPIDNSNIECQIIKDFNDIATVSVGGLLCTSFEQTINDMLESPYSDLQSLLQALSDYYYSNHNSFDELEILPRNVDKFNKIKQWAVEYYNGG